MAEQMSEYMSGQIPGPKSDHESQHMADFTAGKMPEDMPTRTSNTFASLYGR